MTPTTMLSDTANQNSPQRSTTSVATPRRMPTIPPDVRTMARCERAWVRAADLRAAGLSDREGEYGVQVEARRGDHSDAKHQRDHNRRSLQLGERLAVQHVSLQVQHGRPDPHRGQHLDQGEPPVAEQQLDPVEEHREGSDGQGKGSQPRPGAAQPQEHLVHDLPVAVPDGLDELLDLRTRNMPPPGRPVDTARRCGPARSVGRRCRRPLGCIPLEVHWDALHEQLRCLITQQWQLGTRLIHAG